MILTLYIFEENIIVILENNKLKIDTFLLNERKQMMQEAILVNAYFESKLLHEGVDESFVKKIAQETKKSIEEDNIYKLKKLKNLIYKTIKNKKDEAINAIKQEINKDPKLINYYNINLTNNSNFKSELTNKEQSLILTYLMKKYAEYKNVSLNQVYKLITDERIKIFILSTIGMILGLILSKTLRHAHPTIHLIIVLIGITWLITRIIYEHYQNK